MQFIKHRALIIILLFYLISYNSYCNNINTFLKYKNILIEYINTYWKDLTPKEVIPAQIEQESNWNEYAERKVGKEYGFGLSQTTIVKGYFNNFIEFKKRWKKELKNWKWNNRFEGKYHIKIVILYDKLLYNKMSFCKQNLERLAFTLSAYNGGLGWVLKDRRLTKIKGYNPNLWFHNVELFSKRNKWTFKINRNYVREILFNKIYKYFNYL